MKTPLLNFTCAAALLLGACLAQAQQTAPPPDRDAGDNQRGDRGNRGGDRGSFQGRGGFGGGPGGLSLDDKQRELYREASEKNREGLTKLDEQLRTAQKELIQATLAEKYDDKTVQTKAEAVAKIQTEMTILRAKAFSTVAPTLSAEQREQLENSRFGAMMLTSGGMGGFGGGPGGPGGPGGDQGGRFRGRDGQSAQPGQSGQPGQPGAGNENVGDRGGRRGGRPPGQ